MPTHERFLDYLNRSDIQTVADTPATTGTVPDAQTQLAPPAGGTGAEAGCFEDATNRDLAITAITAGRADQAAVRAEVVKGVVDMAAFKVAQDALDDGLQRIGIMPVGDKGTTSLMGGIAQHITDIEPELGYTVTVVDPDVAGTTVVPAGGTGADAGGWDTAANRNLGVASLNAIKTDTDDLRVQITALVADRAAMITNQNAIIAGLEALGFINPSGTTPHDIPDWLHSALLTEGSIEVADLGAGTAAAPGAATQVALAAQGAGATAGGYDTAGNRNDFITALTETQAQGESLNVAVSAWVSDQGAMRDHIAAVNTALNNNGLFV